MTTKTMDTAEPNDSDLVAESLGGSREAFRQIVERYQTLICSMAYCATGNVSQSQDMAQETFIAAWKDLPSLREPQKLRAWLCRIVRNRVSKSYRREISDPVANAAPLEEVHDVPAIEAQPGEQTITREEEAIMWRSLEKIPETYREPLILFYREHQSVESVAAALELSEDAVKQRLSRGRKLLQEEVQAFVEKTLLRTAPGSQFSGAVLAALPLTTGSMATASASLGAKGVATAKAGFMALWLLPLAPFIGIFAGFLSQLSGIQGTLTGRQRWIKSIQITAFWILVPGFCVVGETAVALLRQHYAWNDRTDFCVRAGFWSFYTFMLATWMICLHRRYSGRLVIAAAHARPASTPRPATPVREVMNTLGIHLAMFLWLIALAWRAEDHLTAGLVAVLVALLGTWRYFASRKETGGAHVRATFGYVGLCGAIIVAVFNLRLDVWLATNRGVSVAEIHQLYPMWLVPALSVALGLWVALLLILPAHQRRAYAGGGRERAH